MMQLLSSTPKNGLSQIGNASGKITNDAKLVKAFENLLQGELGEATDVKKLLSEVKDALKNLGISLNENSSEGELAKLLQGLEQIVDTEFNNDLPKELLNAMEQIDSSDVERWKSEGLPEELQSLLQLEQKELLNISEADKEKLAEGLEVIIQQLEKMQKKSNTDVIQMNLSNVPIDLNVNSAKNLKIEEGSSMKEQLQKLWQRFEQISGRLTNETAGQQQKISESFDQKTMLQLKQVLEQMTKVASQSKNISAFKETLAQISKQGSTEQQQLFSGLMKNFSNRKSMPASYNQQMPISSKDISKWVSQALTQSSQGDQSATAQATNFSSAMAKVEQYVIHMNSNQSQPVMQNQMMEQLEQLVKSNRMFQNNAGQTEMNIRLKPQHLGDMTVRLVQMNGEMTVKLMVTSQAAKDMLESNMNQLRHMFSPQQVVVDKTELASGQNLFSQEDKDTGNSEEQSQSSKQQNNEQSSDESLEDEDELSFEEILLNEKA